MKPQKRRLLSGFLAAALLLGNVPMPSGAAQTDGLCSHHPQHTAQCGYCAPAAEVPCGHIHDDGCSDTVTRCVHIHGDCGYVPAVEGHDCDCQPEESGDIVHREGCGYVEAADEVPCGHTCSGESGCITQVLNCPHVHDEACGYTAAMTEVPCGYVCTECEKEAADQEAADAVAAQVAALADIGQAGATLEERNASYTQFLLAKTAYEALSDAQKASIPEARQKLRELNDYYDILIAAGEITTGTQDSTPPTLVSVTLGADSVAAPGTLEVILEVVDDASGVDTVFVDFKGKGTGKTLRADSCTPYPDGKLHSTLQIDRYVGADVFEVDCLYLCDAAGNEVTFHRTGDNTLPDSLLALTFTVTESTPPASPEDRLMLPEKDFAHEAVVWLDGIALSVQQDDAGQYYVDLPEEVPPVLVTYSYNSADGDVHRQYPTGMKVYRIEGGTTEPIPELDNLLQYSGSSIRIAGKKGIRMITSVDQNTRKQLTGKGIAGFTLLEYGTLLGQISKLDRSNLVLGGTNVKSNFAYKKGVADPVYKYTNGLIQYTNVLVGFTDDQCAEDIVMRPYMKLQDKTGKEFVIYGGIVERSIGYIAYQNRNAFRAKTAAYEYVWSIIHNVYNKQFDSEYQQ